ncbi:MAG: hypothetical protein IPI43_16315 [Sandaracinaceae bacterium]|nr:hypothetical protein [Sandaracinaceae bacterium]
MFARANYVQSRSRQWRVVPVMVIAGYVNSAADFELGVADFQQFLASIQLPPSESVNDDAVAEASARGAARAEAP